MRNIFDQYREDENRLSHALACTLSRDAALLREWLRRWTGRAVGVREEIRVGQQCYGDDVVSGAGRADSLPDICVWGDDWTVVIECKVGASDNHEQLRRHMRNVKRRGYSHVSGVFLSPRRSVADCSDYVYSQWSEQFAWFSLQSGRWAEDFCQYMRCMESDRRRQGIDDGSAFTMFAGIPFDDKHTYTQREGKIVLRDLREALIRHDRMRRLGADPKSEGRGAITGRGLDTVWDFIGLAGSPKGDFTSSPHFTLGLHRDKVEAAITIPHRVKGGFRRKLSEITSADFAERLRELSRATRGLVSLDPNARCEARVLQRHYIAQRIPYTDASLTFDLRTTEAKGRGPVRYQPHWAEAAFAALSEKRSNLQFQVLLTFPYGMRELKDREKAVDLWLDGWAALKPVMALSGH